MHDAGMAKALQNGDLIFQLGLLLGREAQLVDHFNSYLSSRPLVSAPVDDPELATTQHFIRVDFIEQIDILLEHSKQSCIRHWRMLNAKLLNYFY